MSTMIKCLTSDSKVVRVPIDVLKATKVYKAMLEDLEVSDGAEFEEKPLSLGPVNKATFELVVEFIRITNGSLLE